MVQINLTPKQVEELKNHYILELEKLQQRSTEIMGILSKLAHQPLSNEKPIEEFQPLPEKLLKKTQTAETTDVMKRRRGRPSNLPDLNGFIIQILKEKNKPLTSEEILKELLQQYKTRLAGSTTVKASLNQALYRMHKKRNLITRTRKTDKKENLYSLVSQAYIPIAAKGTKEENKTEVPKSKLPPETNYNFPQFIIDTLDKNKRLLSLNDFIKYAIAHYKLPSSDKKSLYGKISPVLTQLVKSKHKLRSIKRDGISYKYYGLNEWFNSNDELMTIYK